MCDVFKKTYRKFPQMLTAAGCKSRSSKVEFVVVCDDYVDCACLLYPAAASAVRFLQVRFTPPLFIPLSQEVKTLGLTSQA